MEYAGPIAFIRTILIILLVYYALKFIIRFLLPIFFGTKKNNNQGKPNSGSDRKKRKDSNLGEYIDFEEIEDTDHEKD